MSFVSTVVAVFVAAFCPEAFLANFFNDVILFCESSASFPAEKSMETLRKRLNGILKEHRKKAALAGEEESGKEVTKTSRIALGGLFVLLSFEKARRSGSGLILSMVQFLEKYPEFSSLSIEERCALLSFRNFMAVSLTLEEAKNNKAFHMEICARLSEGSDAKYITGSGQSSATSRRVSIYEREGNVDQQMGSRKVKRESDTDSESAASSKRSRAESISDYASDDSDSLCSRSARVPVVNRSAFREDDPYVPEDQDLLDLLASLDVHPVSPAAAALDVESFEMDDFSTDGADSPFDQDMLFW